MNELLDKLVEKNCDREKIGTIEHESLLAKYELQQ